MKIKKRTCLFIGIFLLLFLLVSYFIKINVEQGANYAVKSSLLGIIIFYNLYVLAFYILIGLFFIFLDIKSTMWQALVLLMLKESQVP